MIYKIAAFVVSLFMAYVMGIAGVALFAGLVQEPVSLRQLLLSAGIIALALIIAFYILLKGDDG